ncbi:MAG: type II toxin-antitoxin system RelE/ParE family toxin [Clostridia bacterium]|nr:type II toxin-antitoxin system RelE/ParE family toxin [Clostridia bacterium]
MGKTYKVEFTERAKKQLHKLDRQRFLILTNWIAKNLSDCENPRLHGKALTANHAGKWRYRVGDYRILAKIDDNRIIIFVLEVGHRREIYD